MLHLLVNRDSWTPLMCAAHVGDTGIVQELLQASASINVQDVHGRTALFLACDEGEASQDDRYECAKLIIQHGRYCGRRGVRLFLWHWVQLQRQCHQQHQHHHNIEELQLQPQPHWAIAQLCYDVIRRICQLAMPEPPIVLETHAHIGSDITNITPLMQAAETGQTKCVELLIQYGAKLDTKNSEGEDAESLAQDEECQAMLRHHRVRRENRMKIRDIRK